MIRDMWRKLMKWEPIYWLRTHTIHRYHIIDIRGQAWYRWGWVDRSDAMLFACFKILCDFVEQEYPGYVDWQYDETSRQIDQEIHELYEWWKHGRAEEWRNVDRMYSTTGMTDEWHAAYDAAESRDVTNLDRLIVVRPHLWT